METNSKHNRTQNRLIGGILIIMGLVLVLTLILGPTQMTTWLTRSSKDVSINPTALELWKPPTLSQLPAGEAGKLITYGRELIVNTSAYLGPKGSVQHISNGMNCQNCHLDAGTKLFGNNYSAVASTYPKYRARSGVSRKLLKNE
jgi:thiosulfate dehydrogenase